MGKKNGNGHGVSLFSNKSQQRALNPQQSNEVRQLDQALASSKVGLANVVVRLAQIEGERQRLEAEKSTLVGAVVQAQISLEKRVGELAKERGIDPDDPAKGRWNFNAETMAFTRLE